MSNESYKSSMNMTFFEYVIKKHDWWPPSRNTYQKIENRITFKTNTWYHLELLTPETRELLGTTENKTAQDGNGKNVPYLEINEITEVVSAHCSIFNNFIYKIKEQCILLSQINHICNHFQKYSIFIYWNMVYRSKFSTEIDRG